MNFIDITVALSADTIPWEKDHKFNIKRIAEISSIDPSSYNLSKMEMSVHLGTHVDAPLHFAFGGIDIASLDLRALNGKARVLDLKGLGLAIGEKELCKKNIERGERILLKTDNEGLYGQPEFSRQFVYLTEDGAAFLRDRATKLVGIDYLSVDPWTEPKEKFAFFAHHRLLDPREDGIAPTVILETIDLSQADEGEYELICMPLKILGAEGAPARAILVKRGTLF